MLSQSASLGSALGTMSTRLTSHSPDSRTGTEMEALHAVAVAALTVYDMVKAADKAMTITDVRLEHKIGGKSGDYERSSHAKTQRREEDAKGI